MTSAIPTMVRIIVILIPTTLGTVVSAQTITTFTRITAGPIATSSGATGGAWGDFNNDGWLDLFVSFNSGTTSILYTNNGSGNFAADTSAGISSGTGSSWGSAWGDYDNDGNLDLMGSVYGAGNNYVFHNNGNDNFTRLTGDPIVTNGATGNNAIWADYDNDGFLDAFFAGSTSLLFHNNGDGSFIRVTNSIITADAGGQGCAWADYDNDGFPDLFVTRVNQPNKLYHNNRDGTFAKITNAPFSTDTAISQGCSWGDYDNDGNLDLVVCNVGAKNFLYHNNGNGTFTKITNCPISTVIANSSGSAWADYDNDGYLDLFIAVRGGNSLLFHNNGDGTFTQVVGVNPVNLSGIWIGGAWGDFNNDGFPDLFVGNEAGNNALYLNNGNTNNWLTIQCFGRVSNRAAIDAKIRLKATIGGKTIWQLREISGGGGLASQNDLRVQFGLGDATNADIVRVEWPSGIVQELRDIASRQFLTLKEPSRLKADVSADGSELHLTVAGGKGLLYSLESSTDLANWNFITTLTNQTGMVIWTNQPSHSTPALFFRSKEQ
jgi:enediyne biosynthesis protein E4